jgi:hypothetical protein
VQRRPHRLRPESTREGRIALQLRSIPFGLRNQKLIEIRTAS